MFPLSPHLSSKLLFILHNPTQIHPSLINPFNSVDGLTLPLFWDPIALNTCCCDCVMFVYCHCLFHPSILFFLCFPGAWHEGWHTEGTWWILVTLTLILPKPRDSFFAFFLSSSVASDDSDSSWDACCLSAYGSLLPGFSSLLSDCSALISFLGVPSSLHLV